MSEYVATQDEFILGMNISPNNDYTVDVLDGFIFVMDEDGFIHWHDRIH